MSISPVQYGGAAAVGAVVSGATSGFLLGGDARTIGVGAAVGASSTLAMMLTKEGTGNGLLAAGAGLGTGALVGAGLTLLMSNKPGFAPANKALALGAVFGGVSMLIGAGLMARLTAEE